jgi:hypothetical protein
LAELHVRVEACPELTLVSRQLSTPKPTAEAASHRKRPVCFGSYAVPIATLFTDCSE